MILFGWIISITFLGTFIYSIYLFYISKKCTCKTTGTIIDIKIKKYTYKNGATVTYRAVYRYKVSEIVYENISVFDSKNPNEYKRGQEVLLYYEESNPNHFFVDYDIKLIPKNIKICACVFIITTGMATFTTFFLR